MIEWGGGGGMQKGLWEKRDPLKRDESSPLTHCRMLFLYAPLSCVCIYLFHVYVFTCSMYVCLPVPCVCVFTCSLCMCLPVTCVFTCSMCVCLPVMCVCLPVPCVYLYLFHVLTCSMCFDVAGFDGNIHWQEMPIYWQRQHPWPYLVGCGAQDEDAEDDSDPSWIPSLRQEVQPLREEAQEHVCSPQPSFQVCTLPSVYSTVFWGDGPALVFYTFFLIPRLCSVLSRTALYSTVKFPLFLSFFFITSLFFHLTCFIFTSSFYLPFPLLWV